MALQATDLFIVERSGVQYQMTSAQIADFVGAVRDLTATSYSNMLAGTFVGGDSAKAGDRVFIADASGDPDVDAGYAGYRVNSISPIDVTKIYEQESMDVVVTGGTTNLSVTRNASSVVIENDNGDNATIPLADGTNAGLMPPAAFSNSHSPSSSGLTAATNPVVVNASSQEVTFNITQLDPLP